MSSIRHRRLPATGKIACCGCSVVPALIAIESDDDWFGAMMDKSKPTKETIILVHGTWAAPMEGRSQWYQPCAGSFASKLGQALGRHGHAAKCWSHCAAEDAIFSWNGANSWLDRASGAERLIQYINQLKGAGWTCHVVAHSHGGNLVMEALPSLLAQSRDQGFNHAQDKGTFVFLGTPFIDTISAMSQQQARRQRLLAILLWCVYVMLVSPLIVLVAYYASVEGVRSLYSGAHAVQNIVVVFLTFLTVVLPPFFFAFRKKRLDWTGLVRELAASTQWSRKILVVNNAHDEARVVLHHARMTENPLATGTSLFGYLSVVCRKLLERKRALSRIRGATYFSAASLMVKLAVASVYLLAFFVLAHVLQLTDHIAIQPERMNIFVGGAATLLISTLAIGAFVSQGALLSAIISPFRWTWEMLSVAAAMPSETVTFVVRHRAWPMLQRFALGLEAYPYQLPVVSHLPTLLPTGAYTYEELPSSAIERSLAKRHTGISSHLGNMSDFLAKATITSADLSSLLEELERDVTLVHAAYYTDDECIDRVARWIAGKG